MHKNRCSLSSQEDQLSPRAKPVLKPITSFDSGTSAANKEERLKERMKLQASGTRSQTVSMSVCDGSSPQEEIKGLEFAGRARDQETEQKGGFDMEKNMADTPKALPRSNKAAGKAKKGIVYLNNLNLNLFPWCVSNCFYRLKAQFERAFLHFNFGLFNHLL